ncbi:MAG: prephenate dehydrogenase [Planctomycetaceae bacterium]|nr:prephenate dehydrogenase [Planctomycetaceae bacterium]
MSILTSHLIIIGVGLLGSSIGLAAKKRGLADTVIGIGRRRETLDIALQRKAVDAVATELDILAEMNDGLAIICTPVRSIVGDAKHIAAVNGNLLISDVGSTKANICYALDRQGLRFIGAHPIAGSEKSGPEFGNADLFQDRLTVLTPTASSRAKDVERLQHFWESLGSRILQLEPQQHDAILAKTSHLPHAVAAALASLITEAERPFCGTGFADTTRIASGPSAVWTDIFLENRLQLLAFLEVFGDRLASLKTALEANDVTAVNRFLESAKKNIQ